MKGFKAGLFLLICFLFSLVINFSWSVGLLRADTGIKFAGSSWQQLEREGKVGEEKVILKFKDAPLKDILQALADAFGFYYVIRYPDFDKEIFSGVKEVKIHPVKSEKKSDQEKTSATASSTSEEGGFSPGFSFEKRKLTFYVSESKKNVKKVVDLFCKAADVYCHYDDKNRLLTINPYEVQIFNYGFFMDYKLDHELGLEDEGSGVLLSANIGGQNTFKMSEKYKEFVREVLSKLCSKEGRIFLSKRGYIIVIDRPSVVERIKKVWKKEMEKREPVVFNVKVIRVDLKKGKEQGINWNGVIEKIFGTDSLSLGFQSGFTLPSSKAVSFVLDSSKFSMLMRLLSEYGDTKIVHDWTVKARSGIPVVFSDIQSIPYLTQSVVMGANTSTTATQPKFVDIGFKITTMGSLLKKCKDDVSTNSVSSGRCQEKYVGQIYVSISNLVKMENLGTGTSPYYVPNVKFSSAVVPFELKSNESIVITSFRTTTREKSQEGMPVLMNIPLLGGLFKYEKDYSGVSEFVVIVTPIFKARHSLGRMVEPEVIYKNRSKAS